MMNLFVNGDAILNFSERFSSMKGKRVAVLGFGVSNRPLAEMLAGAGALVTVRDKGIKSHDELAGYEQMGIRFIMGDGYLDALNEEIIFKTPGIRADTPQIRAAVEAGALLTSEMQLFFDCAPCTVIGITGSDGKTTTTTLTAEMLRASGAGVFLGGNIGKPLLPEISNMNKDDFAVVELSSFQLQTMKSSPDRSVITNITPNHLDYHADMREYIDAKMKILDFQKSNSLAVLNYDDENTVRALERVRGRAVVFSARTVPPEDLRTPEGGKVTRIFLRDGAIYKEQKKILPVKDIKIPGVHNVMNYMAAIGVLDGIVSEETVLSVARSFGGVEHRIEFVRRFNGVDYYNSSIDSSPTRTMAALSSFDKKVIAILGGYDKKIPYDVLGEPLCRSTKAVILTGATADKIKKAVLSSFAYSEGCPAIFEEPDYRSAVLRARDIAEEGDTVLLSPASASFDSFNDFEERGRFFKQMVNDFGKA